MWLLGTRNPANSRLFIYETVLKMISKRGERLKTVIGLRIGRGPIGLSCRMYWDVLMVLFLSLLLNYLPIYNFLNSKLLHFSWSQSWFQWTRLSILLRIMEIEEGVIRRDRRQRGITPSKTSIIFHMIRKPNSIIVLLFIQNNS